MLLTSTIAADAVTGRDPKRRLTTASSVPGTNPYPSPSSYTDRIDELHLRVISAVHSSIRTPSIRPCISPHLRHSLTAARTNDFIDPAGCRHGLGLLYNERRVRSLPKEWWEIGNAAFSFFLLLLLLVPGRSGDYCSWIDRGEEKWRARNLHLRRSPTRRC